MPVKPRVLRPVHPNKGIEVAFRRKLDGLIDDMHRSLLYWLRAAYRPVPAAMAQDAKNPASALIRSMRKLGKRWLKVFNDAAPKLAGWFSQSIAQRSETDLKTILRDAGMTVSFKPTATVQDAMKLNVTGNVGLIKSIAQEHLVRVEGAVMRSAMVGRDLQALTKELEQGYGITRRRAAFIAKDQTNKMTAVIVRTRQAELGIKKAMWLHSGGGNHPRPEHVAFSGQLYDVAKGAYLKEGKTMVWTWPGHEINCRCVSKTVLPGMT